MGSKKSSKGDRASRHVRLYHLVLDSPAWMSLDPVARAAYVEIARRYDGRNNGGISCSLLELAKGLHISKTTAMRATVKLQERGFLVLMKRGAFSLKRRHATTWRLTEFINHVACEDGRKGNRKGDLPTKDFLLWKNQNTVSPGYPNGYLHETVRAPT